jgi:3-hydroxy-9,10-secoandrosta-1,3,5(10)-triene-9,17-dione monooxygenase reductase component
MKDAFDGREFRRILGHYPTGVCVVTALSGSEPVGMVIGSFTSVSLDPALVAFLPGRSSRTWAKIEAAGHFCVNILGEHQQWISRTLSSNAEDKFASIPYRLSKTGLPIIEGVVAWIDCQLNAVHEAGDHFIAIGLVRALQVERPTAPLVFLRGEYGSISSCATLTQMESSAAYERVGVRTT